MTDSKPTRLGPFPYKEDVAYLTHTRVPFSNAFVEGEVGFEIAISPVFNNILVEVRFSQILSSDTIYKMYSHNLNSDEAKRTFERTTDRMVQKILAFIISAISRYLGKNDGGSHITVIGHSVVVHNLRIGTVMTYLGFHSLHEGTN